MKLASRAEYNFKRCVESANARPSSGCCSVCHMHGATVLWLISTCHLYLCSGLIPCYVCAQTAGLLTAAAIV